MALFPTYDYDIIIVGGGSAGLACAKQASELGAKVLCIDYVKPTPNGRSWGIAGTCVNVGYMPKKLMHQAALLGEALHDATFYGWQIPYEEDITLSWSHMVSAIQGQIKYTNWLIKVELRTRNITYLNGMASFVDNHTVEVKLKYFKKQKHTAKYIVIAIGLRPVYSDIPGAREYGITSDDLFSLPKPPGKILIVGAGYIGMDCGGFLRMFGFDVTIMVRGVVLRNFDRQMADIVTESLKERGIKFLTPCKPLSVEKLENGRLLVRYENVNTSKIESEYFDTVLWATGRKGYFEDLNIKAVKLAVENDLIVVSDEERTNVENIYAVGDIAKGRSQLTPVAIHAGQLLAQRLFSDSTQIVKYQNISTTLFTPLEYGFVGMTEEAATKTLGEDNIEVYHSYYHPLEFSLSEKVLDFCYIKIIAQRYSKKLILGMHFVGPNAGDVFQGFFAAINCGLTMDTLFNTLGDLSNAQEIAQTYITKRSGISPAVDLKTVFPFIKLFNFICHQIAQIYPCIS